MSSEPIDGYASEAVTRNLRVSVEARFDPSRSSPPQGRWFFLYTVTLTNDGRETVQLLTRHWIIQDGRGRIEEVQGAGVVGETPVLAPGSSYRYTSGCPLATDFGSMRGSYGMVTAGGERFDAEIGEFVLTVPGTVN